MSSRPGAITREFVTSGYFGGVPGDPDGGLTRVVTQNNAGAHHDPFNSTPMGVNSISPAHLRLRPMERTSTRAGVIEKKTHLNNITALLRGQGRRTGWASRPTGANSRRTVD